ncbi:MAG TPA: SDR family oxidoreductase [Aestuariivirgaceae bacterium]|nr:SDR family oxidoreductase [Aestuariivirgaceae bacterium]
MIADTFRSGLFKGKTALVTGAARGIGRGIAEALAGLEATVVVNDIRAADLERAVAAIRQKGGTAVAAAGDLADPAIADRIFEATLGEHGRIDFLINNAGRSWNVDTGEIDDDTMQALVELNFKSVVRLARAYVRQARQRGGGGAIVQIASTAGVAGFERRAVYAGTKFAMIGLTKVLALDHARDGITVNAVLPHVVDTEMFRSVAKPEEAARWRAGIPMGRFATVEEVAAMVVFLCSPAASYLTGGVYPVDGGFLAGPYGAD